MCPETRRLVLKYHEATAVHSAFTQAREAQQKPGIENFLWQMEQARIARETAWTACEKHVAEHGCQWLSEHGGPIPGEPKKIREPSPDPCPDGWSRASPRRLTGRKMRG